MTKDYVNLYISLKDLHSEVDSVSSFYKGDAGKSHLNSVIQKQRKNNGKFALNNIFNLWSHVYIVNIQYALTYS